MTASANSVHNNAVHILPYFKRNSLYEVVRTQIVSLQLVCVYFFSVGREVQRGTLWHTYLWSLRNKYSVLDFAIDFLPLM